MANDSKKQSAETQEEVRLNVFLQESGVASRRKADELIQSGMVKVNGKSVTQLGIRIRRTDKVHVHGKLLTVKSIPKVVYVLNKPDMCLTTRFDAKGRRTIFDLPAVKTLPPNVQAVGRLDYRSEGLLLLTNDGDLAYALTHPRFSVEKSYAVLVADGVTIEDVEKLRAGVMLDDGLAKAVSVRLGNKERLGATRGQWLELVVTEGRNRLIRRMAEAIGLKVVRLVRVGMGDVLLPATLKPGQAIPVDSIARNQLEQVKHDMLRSVESQEQQHGSSGMPDELTRAKRKLRRQIKLNDEEYEIESSRRSAEASVKRKQRGQQQREAVKGGETDRPIPRAEQPRREGRDGLRAEQPRRESRDGLRSEQPRREGRNGPRAEQPRREGRNGPRAEQPRREGRNGPRSEQPRREERQRPMRSEANAGPRSKRPAADGPRAVRRSDAQPKPAKKDSRPRSSKSTSKSARRP